MKACRGAGCSASLRSEPMSSMGLGRSAQLSQPPESGQKLTEKEPPPTSISFTACPGFTLTFLAFQSLTSCLPRPSMMHSPKVLSSVRVLPDLTSRPTTVLGVLVAVTLCGVSQTLGFTSQIPDFFTKKMWELLSFSFLSLFRHHIWSGAASPGPSTAVFAVTLFKISRPNVHALVFPTVVPTDCFRCLHSHPAFRSDSPTMLPLACSQV